MKVLLINISPLIFFRNVRSSLRKTGTDSVPAVCYDLLQCQIWALLPSFCAHATDISTTFPVSAFHIFFDNRNICVAVNLFSLRICTYECVMYGSSDHLI